MLHLPLLINTLPGEQVVGEECLAVTGLQTLKEESSPSPTPCSEDEARGTDLPLILGSHKGVINTIVIYYADGIFSVEIPF